MTSIGRIVVAAAAASLLVGALVAPAAGADSADRTYRVTVTNLTTGQPLTPVLFATHRASTDVFAVGAPASVGVKEIA